MMPSQLQAQFQEGTQEKEFSFGDLLGAALDYLWLIIALIAISAAVGYYVIRKTPVEYKSTGVLLAEIKKDKILNIQELETEQRVGTQDAMNTLAASVTRTEVLLGVANRIAGERFVRHWSTNELSTNDIASLLRFKCDASVRRQSRFIDVSATDGDPEVAQKLAQVLMEEFLANEVRRRQGSGEGATNFLSMEANKLKQQLTESETLLSAFLRTNTVSVRESDDIVSAELRSLNESLLEAKAKRLALEADWEQIRQLASDPEKLLTIPAVVQLENVGDIRSKYLEKQSEIAQLELRYKSKHPKMIEARRALESIRNALYAEVRNAPNGVQLNLKKAELAEVQLAQRVKEQEVRVAEIAELRMAYNRLKTTADHHRELYESLRKRAGEARLSMNVAGRENAKHDVSIFEEPRRPKFAFQPNKRKIMGVSLVMGFGLAFGLVYLLQMLDQTVKSVDQAEQIFGIPVLGAIPKSSDDLGKDERLVITKSPDSHAAEGFRTLRAAIGLLGREDERKVTMFTSAVPSEGKTFCSSNFAMAMAQSGNRTVIVDFDLRRPSVGNTFGIDMLQEGVSDCLLGKLKYDEVMVPTENSHLFVIPAGTLVPNPSELIASPHTKEFLDELRGAFDHVVVDNAPVTAVSDTLMIADMVDNVSLVTRANKTPIRVIGRAIELVRRAGVNPSGLVLNFITNRRGAGHKYYYYSDKKYAGGYGSQNRKKARS